MKRYLFTILCALACVLAHAQERTLAFPEAEGFGKYTTGGRGGNVYYVTSLEDCSDGNLVPGTLRWALSDGDDTPRTVLFKVCGTIYLTSRLKLQHPNVTIAGQTAPGGGICIAGANIYVCKPNVIIRYIRFRAGDVPNTNYPCLDVENTKNVIIDHCSMTWSMEECLTMYDCDSTTVQWTIIGEGLYNSKHHKGTRSYAMQWGGEHSSMHHCLITNCHSRTPRFNGVRDEANMKNGKHDHDAQVDSEFFNNVIFNWGKTNSAYGGEYDTTKNRSLDNEPMGWNRVYMVNNYFRAGPTTKVRALSSRYFVQASDKLPSGQWYINGNMFELSNTWNNTSKAVWKNESLSLVNNNNLYGFVENNSARAFNINNVTPSQEIYDRYILTAPVISSGLEAQPASEAFEQVCLQAGASLPRYDEEDTRLLAEAAGDIDPVFFGPTQKNWLGIIDSQDDILFARCDTFMVNDSLVGGYPFLDAISGDSLILDTDGDGLPDRYETEKGLNPTDATDAAQLTASGYSELELYLNGVASGTINKTRYESDTYVSQQPKAAADESALEALPQQPNATWTQEEGQWYILKNGNKYSVSGQKLQ